MGGANIDAGGNVDSSAGPTAGYIGGSHGGSVQTVAGGEGSCIFLWGWGPRVGGMLSDMHFALQKVL